MRYAELIEYAFPKIQQVDVKSHRHPARGTGRDPDTEYVGGGSFADAFANPKRTPHDIRKLSNRPRDAHDIDGFFYYIKALEQNPDNTNPYFPRFRQIKIYINRDDAQWSDGETDPRRDEITYSAQMERLEDLRLISKKERKAIYRRIFGDNFKKAMKSLKRVPDHPYGEPMLTVIQQAVKHAGSRAGLNGYMVDEDFIRATTFIKKIADKYSIGLDLHDENIMFRRGPTGLHLVLTDPLSFVHSGISHQDDITAD